MSNAKADRTAMLTARIGFYLGLVFLAFTLIFPAPPGLSETAWSVAGLGLLMATWWSTEAIPIPVTSLLPIVLIPALGVGTVGQATQAYSNPLIFLFLGGFLLGMAMQRWNLHRRIALHILLSVGMSPARQIGGFMLATGFLSMWVSNTATAIMMLPIGLSVVSVFANAKPEQQQKFATALLLAIAYSASIGGIATLIGTPPNALLAGYLQETKGITLGFAQWMSVGLPVTVVMMLAAWWWLTRGGFDLGNMDSEGDALREELRKLGPYSTAEKRVTIVFFLTALAWIFRPLLDGFAPWLNDTSIAIAAGVILFIIPADIKQRVFLMDWKSAEGLPWGVLLLFGGGLSLAGVIQSSGLAAWIAESMSAFGVLPLILMVAIVVTVIVFLTEVTSNTATAAAFLPLIGAMAMGQDVSPLLMTVPAAIAASLAFMMPVATPPNAIVFGSGQLRIQSMIRAGFALNIAGIIVVTLLAYSLVLWFWV